MTPLIIVAERNMFERKENRNCIFERFVLLFMKRLNKNDTQHSTYDTNDNIRASLSRVVLRKDTFEENFLT